MRPRNLLLRLYLWFFGAAGVQLTRVRWSRVSSGLAFTFTLSVTSVGTVYLAKNVKTRISLTVMTHLVGNAFGSAMDSIFNFAYLIVFLLLSFYYFLFGYSITRLANTPLLARSFRSRRKSMHLFLKLTAAIHVLFCLYYRKYLTSPFITGSFDDVMRLFSTYLFHLRHYLVWMLVLYVKFATWQRLEDCRVHLQRGGKRENEVIATVQALARLNCKFSRQVSFLLATFLAHNVLLAIYSLFKIIVLGRMGKYIEFLFLTSLYLLYLVKVDDQIQQQMKQLCEEIKNRFDPMRSFECYLGNSTNDVVISLDLVDQIVKVGCDLNAPRFRLQEIGIYREYFRLEIYQLCVVDLRLVLNTFGFTLCYCVLAIQTTNLKTFSSTT